MLKILLLLYLVPLLVMLFATLYYWDETWEEYDARKSISGLRTNHFLDTSNGLLVKWFIITFTPILNIMASVMTVYWLLTEKDE